MSLDKDPDQHRAPPATEPFFRRVIAGLLFVAIAAGAYAATQLF
jgi:hypothetical protein